MGLEIDCFKCAVDFSSRSRVSEMVEEGEWVRRRTRASIAAIGIVMSGSDSSNSLYVATMLVGQLAVALGGIACSSLTQMAWRHWTGPQM